jgi:hypothetical protein
MFLIENENYDDERDIVRTIYSLLRRKQLVCRAEKCGEKSDGGAGDLEDGKS